MLFESRGKLVERNLAKVEVTPNALKIGNLECRSAHTKKLESPFRNERAFLRL